MVGKKQKASYLYGSWVLFVLAAALEPASSQTGGTGCDDANCTTTVTTTTVTTTTSVTTGTRQDGGSTTTAAPGLPPSSVKAGVLAGALSGTVIVIFALVVVSCCLKCQHTALHCSQPTCRLVLLTTLGRGGRKKKELPPNPTPKNKKAFAKLRMKEEVVASCIINSDSFKCCKVGRSLFPLPPSTYD